MTAASALPADPQVPSPCTGVCRIDEADGRCAGCLRRLDEIAAWSGLDDTARREVLERIDLRRRTPPLR